MTETRKWLGRARTIDRELHALVKTRQETMDLLTSITQNYATDGAQSTKDPHKYDKLVELDNLIDQRTMELIRVRSEILTTIGLVQSGAQRTVLISYYVRGKTLEDIAEEMGCSSRNVQNIRKRGIAWVEKNITEVPCFST